MIPIKLPPKEEIDATVADMLKEASVFRKELMWRELTSIQDSTTKTVSILPLQFLATAVVGKQVQEDFRDSMIPLEPNKPLLKDSGLTSRCKQLLELGYNNLTGYLVTYHPSKTSLSPDEYEEKMVKAMVGVRNYLKNQEGYLALKKRVADYLGRCSPQKIVQTEAQTRALERDLKFLGSIRVGYEFPPVFASKDLSKL